MAKYRCQLCGYIYDEEKEGIKFKDLPDDWQSYQTIQSYAYIPCTAPRCNSSA